MLAVATTSAQETTATTTLAAAASVVVAPAEVRELIVEGRAPIGENGVLRARKAAEADALRTAVEQATGVFVSARTLVHNYATVRDEIVTRAEGFATIKEIVSETVARGEVRVTLRALVSLRPLAARLKALNLTRAWRVYVAGASDEAALVVATLERTLADAGFVVVSKAGDADIAVRVTPRFTTLAATPLDTAAGPMTMHSLRGQIGVRATRAPTGEVVAALSAAGTGLHIEADTARTMAASKALATLAPRLADALLVLPAQASQPVTLVVTGLGRVTLVGKLENALQTLVGVRDVVRRSWAKNTATWELDVTTDALPLLSRALEESAALRPFHLSVGSESRAKITASAATPFTR